MGKQGMRTAAWLTVFGCAVAQAGGGASFDELDANADGAIDRSEARAVAWLDERFEAVDADDDGAVTRTELASAKAKGESGDDDAGRQGGAI